ncbi:hypothetical protein Hanom_Chr10g00881841 [Helianthus anomalus]
MSRGFLRREVVPCQRVFVPIEALITRPRNYKRHFSLVGVLSLHTPGPHNCK